jgi:uncharacterized DUF497 family protein
VEFDWDDAKIDHIARHGVQPEEAEEVPTAPSRVAAPAYRSQNGERRQAGTGRTDEGCLLTVILTRRGDLSRVVTAREASASERHADRR